MQVTLLVNISPPKCSHKWELLADIIAHCIHVRECVNWMLPSVNAISASVQGDLHKVGKRNIRPQQLTQAAFTNTKKLRQQDNRSHSWSLLVSQQQKCVSQPEEGWTGWLRQQDAQSELHWERSPPSTLSYMSCSFLNLTIQRFHLLQPLLGEVRMSAESLPGSAFHCSPHRLLKKCCMSLTVWKCLNINFNVSFLCLLQMWSFTTSTLNFWFG